MRYYSLCCMIISFVGVLTCIVSPSDTYACSKFQCFMLRRTFVFGNVWKDINQISFWSIKGGFFCAHQEKEVGFYLYTTCQKLAFCLVFYGCYFRRVYCHQPTCTLREHITKTSQTKEKNTKNHVCSLFPWNEWNIDYYCFPLIQVVLFIKHFNVMWGNTSSISCRSLNMSIL